MKLADAGTFLGSHLIAGIVYGLIFGAIPLILALVGLVVLFILAIVYNDPGGPLWLPMYLVGCFLYALAVLATGLVLFGFSAIIQAIRKKLRSPWWVPPLAFPLLILTLLWVTSCARPVIWAVITALPFIVYWLSLMSAESIANRIRKRNVDKNIKAQQGGPGYPPQGVGSPDP